MDGGNHYGKLIMDGAEKIVFTSNAIEFVGYPADAYIMHTSETRVMQELARIATQIGGDILEIGFGLGISADFIQSHNINSHTIIEVHPEIYARAVAWAENKPNTTVIFGDWYTVLPSMNKTFDGVLHDTHEDVNLREFFKVVPCVCKDGTVVATFRYPFNDVPLNKVDVHLTEYERVISPIPNIKKFTLGWNIYTNGEFHV
jgi:spermidine synthase